MDWLTNDWDQGHWISFAVGLAAGVTLAVWRLTGLAELGAVGVAVCARWSLWQIPPPGRSRATGTPPDGWARMGQVIVAVLLATLVVDVAAGSAG